MNDRILEYTFLFLWANADDDVASNALFQYVGLASSKLLTYDSCKDKHSNQVTHYHKHVSESIHK